MLELQLLMQPPACLLHPQLVSPAADCISNNNNQRHGPLPYLCLPYHPSVSLCCHCGIQGRPASLDPRLGCDAMQDAGRPCKPALALLSLVHCPEQRWLIPNDRSSPRAGFIKHRTTADAEPRSTLWTVPTLTEEADSRLVLGRWSSKATPTPPKRVS